MKSYTICIIFHIFASDNQLTMSRFVIYIKLETYLHQWLTHHLGNPVVFPAQSNENATIRRFLQKQPDGTRPQLAKEGLTAICIPDSKAKDPSVFNYMGPSGKEAVVECIEDLFRRNLWHEMGDLAPSRRGVNGQIAAWCEMHGIGIDYIETVRQKYYRMRKAYAKKGLN